MSAPLHLRPAVSVLGISLIAAIHMVAAIAFLQIKIGLWVVPALAGICASLCVALRGERAKCKLGMRLEDAGEMTISRDGEDARHVVCRGGVDFGWAVWIGWCKPGERWSRDAGAIMLTRDAFDETSWRRLRVWLRYRSTPTDDLSSEASSRVV